MTSRALFSLVTLFYEWSVWEWVAPLRGQPRWEMGELKGLCKFGFSHHTCITPHGAFGYPTWVWPQVHLPEAITTKSDFLMCEYLFIMKMLLGWGGVRWWDVGGDGGGGWTGRQTDKLSQLTSNNLSYNPLYHHYSVHLHGKSGRLSRACFNPIVPTLRVRSIKVLQPGSPFSPGLETWDGRAEASPSSPPTSSAPLCALKRMNVTL